MDPRDPEGDQAGQGPKLRDSPAGDKLLAQPRARSPQDSGEFVG